MPAPVPVVPKVKSGGASAKRKRAANALGIVRKAPASQTREMREVKEQTTIRLAKQVAKESPPAGALENREDRNDCPKYTGKATQGASTYECAKGSTDTSTPQE